MSLADLIANGVGLPGSLRPAIGYSIALSILVVAIIFPMPATMNSAVPEPGMAISIAITTLSLFFVRFKIHSESSPNH
jgi:hypothetical protein